MFKKLIFAVALATLAFGQAAKAQTNLQVFYDFGKDRQHVTTTLEGFYADNWGNTFFFVDYDYNAKDADGKSFSPSGTYFEIARCLNFWHDVPVLNGFSLHVEYNGGLLMNNPQLPDGSFVGYGINHAFLAGIDYFLHSQDFNNTFNFKVLYKKILTGVSEVPLQFTFVWGMQDLFGLKGLRFSGFADFWWEIIQSLLALMNWAFPSGPTVNLYSFPSHNFGIMSGSLSVFRTLISAVRLS